MGLKLFALSCLLAVAISADLTKAKTSLRISNGKNAYLGQFPHQVSLQKKDGSEYYEHFCGGSIISDKWILTAGHCIFNFLPVEKLAVKYGQYNLTKLEEILAVKVGKLNLRQLEDTEQVARVSMAFVHKTYLKFIYESLMPGPYDIGLMKLKTSLKFNEYVKPIKLPEAGEATFGRVILSGWGSLSEEKRLKSPVLQTAVLDTWSIIKCHSKLSRRLTSEDDDLPLDYTHLCTKPGAAICDGDSGGPLISTNESEEKQIVGVASWGAYPCDDPYPSVFVKVSAFIKWINSTKDNN